MWLRGGDGQVLTAADLSGPDGKRAEGGNDGDLEEADAGKMIY
jgi:hypothetical protein